MQDKTTQDITQVDELQQAIDSIAADNNTEVADTAAQMMNMSAMPMPPQENTTAGTQSVMPAQEVNKNEEVNLDMPPLPNIGNPKVEECAAESKQDASLNDVKKKALDDLKGLIDKIELPAENRFEIYKELIENNGDKSCIGKAYEAAQAIKDENERAKALIFVVDSINKM